MMDTDAEPLEMEPAVGEGAPDAKPWLDMLREAEQVFDRWQTVCDKVDKQLGDLKQLATGGADREFQIFYANTEVLKNVVYARAPVPVVTPRFRDRKPLPRAAADVLERALITDVEIDAVHDKMVLSRDDMLASGRGVVWVDFTMRRGAPAPVLRHLCRQDFRHSPARKWQEVEWVAKRSWLTRERAFERFGPVAERLKFEKQSLGQDDDTARGAKRAEIWERWHASEGVVVWVSPGCEVVLDMQAPLVDLEGFFPCPRPAYSNIQRDTLIPIPDFLYYKDQVEEINELTARISALSEALRMKGFYAGGQGDLSEAIETALKSVDDRAVLVPVSNFAALGGQPLANSIVWLPLDQVATVIERLVLLRRQLIQDVYEITGLSDIMRGSTTASETATAQQLKAQYGSIRAEARQQEMQRLARDVFRIKAEMMAEAADPAQLLEWSQADLPDMATMQQQAMQAVQAGMDPAQVQQEMANTVTLEAVVEMLRNQRTRPFILEVESDSTIQADEDAEKQRRTEFMQAISTFMAQAVPAMQMAPQLGPFLAESLRFVASGFRAGRAMDTAIDELAEGMGQMQQQGNGEAQAAQAEAEAAQAEMQMKAQEAQARLQIEQQRAAADVQAKQAEMQIKQAEVDASLRKTDAEIEKIMAEIERIRAQTGHTEAQAAAARQQPERNDG